LFRIEEPRKIGWRALALPHYLIVIYDDDDKIQFSVMIPVFRQNN
jgi:hypothetical protein